MSILQSSVVPNLAEKMLKGEKSAVFTKHALRCKTTWFRQVHCGYVESVSAQKYCVEAVAQGMRKGEMMPYYNEEQLVDLKRRGVAVVNRRDIRAASLSKDGPPRQA
ncbi:hypothetical protein Tcan_16495 [Toxocara canis]|uniref:Uncharacterized protein n=2 Tax=Toxocara canis TaxID=6265 RepID=A0A0B2W3G1_TOXCA|nr:hypothetical protein Tcan_16495 [Toxocara canis]